MSGPRRAFVKFDVDALFHLGKLHNLSAAERWLLTTLVLRADWHVRAWAGTLTALADASTLSRNTVADALDRFVALGFVAVRRPFGRHRVGVVELLVYADIVVDKHTASAQSSASQSEPESTSSAQTSATQPDSGRADLSNGRAGLSNGRAGLSTSNPASSDDAAAIDIDIEQTQNDAAKTKRSIEADSHARSSENGSVDREIGVVDQFVDREIGAEILGAR